MFLEFSLPPPYTMLKLGKILDTQGQLCLWSGEWGWACVTWKSPTNAKVSPRLLSLMVETFKSFLFSILTLKTVFLRQTLRLWRVAGSGKIPHFVWKTDYFERNERVVTDINVQFFGSLLFTSFLCFVFVSCSCFLFISSTFLRYAHGYIGWRTGSCNPILCEQDSNHHRFLYTAKWLHISSIHHC